MRSFDSSKIARFELTKGNFIFKFKTDSKAKETKTFDTTSRIFDNA